MAYTSSAVVGDRPSTWRLVTLTALLLSSTGCGAAIRGGQPPDARVDVARRLIAAAYPELATRHGEVSTPVETFMQPRGAIGPFTFRVRLLPADDRRTLQDIPVTVNAVLEATLQFDSDGLWYAHFEGPLVASDRSRAMTETARAHPAWTDADLAAALSSDGAQFGPDKAADFARSIDVQALGEALGHIRKTRRWFHWRLGKSELGAEDIVTPEWAVAVGVNPSRAGQACYVLGFEPYHGRLTTIVTGGANQCK